MTTYIKVNEQSHCLDVIGVVNIDNIVRLRKTGIELIQQIADPVINLEQVVTGDSTVLALLTAWARDVKKLGKKLRFLQVPPPLLEIAKLSNLDKVLDLS